MKYLSKKLIATTSALLLLMQIVMPALAQNIEAQDEKKASSFDLQNATNAPSVPNAPIDEQETQKVEPAVQQDTAIEPKDEIANAATITIEGNTLYANGVPVVLKRADSHNAFVYDLEGNKLSETKILTVYGGAKNADIDGDVSITIDDAKLSSVYGGGYSDGKHSANVSGDVTITATGTKVANIRGGGYASGTYGNAQANVEGKILLNVDTTAQEGHDISGGGLATASKNSAQANVADVQIYSTGRIYKVRGGGTSTASATGTSTATAGNIAIEIVNGDIREVYCGGYANFAGTDASVGDTYFVGENCEIMMFVGGGTATAGVANAGNVCAIINECPNIYGSFLGGGNASNGGTASAGDITIKMQDSIIPAELQFGDVVSAWTNGGGSATGAGSVADVGDTSITMSGGINAGAILGGGAASKGAQANSGSVEINIYGVSSDEIEVSGKVATCFMSVVGGADVDETSTANINSVDISIENSSLDLVMGGNMNGGAPLQPTWDASVQLGAHNKGLQGVAYADELQIAEPISLKMFLPGASGTNLTLAEGKWQAGAEVLCIEFAEGEIPVDWIVNTDEKFAFEQVGNSAVWKLFGAKIGDNKFLELQEAVAAAKSDDTIYLLADTMLSASIAVDKNLMIDGAGYLITGNGVEDAAKHSAFTLKENAELNIKNANIANTHTAICMDGAGAKLTVDNCNLDSKYCAIDMRNIGQKLRVENSVLAGWAGIKTSTETIDAHDNKQVEIDVSNSTINARSLDSDCGYAAIALQGKTHKVNLKATNTTFNIEKNKEFAAKKMAAVWVRAYGSTISLESCNFNLKDSASSEQGIITITNTTATEFEEASKELKSRVTVSNATINADGEYKTVSFNDTSLGSNSPYRADDFVKFNGTVYVSCLLAEDGMAGATLQLKLEGGELEKEPEILINKVTLPSASRSGYNFEGWEDLQGTVHKAGDKITVVKDSALAAKWAVPQDGGAQDSVGEPPAQTETESKTEGDIKTDTTVTTKVNEDGSKTTQKSEIATNVVTGEKTEIKATETIANDGSITREETKVITSATGEKTQEKLLSNIDAKTGTSTTAKIKTDVRGKSYAELIAEGTNAEEGIIVSAEMLKAVTNADDAIMMIKTSACEITLDTKAVSAVAASGDKIKIAIKSASPKELAPEVQQELNTAMVVDLSISAGEGKVSSFNGGVATVELAYSMADSAKQIAVYYVAPNGKMTHIVGASYDVKANKVKFPTGHFSHYAIVEEEATAFVDVAADAWYYDAVRSATRNKIFSGISATEFAPNMAMTRGMLVEVLYRIAKPEASDVNAKFLDVSADSYYANAVNWAAENKIIEGYNGKFSPDDSVSREQLAAILYRYAKSTGLTISADGKPNAFTDAADVSAYAIDAITWLCGEKILQGIDGKIAPKACATRAQVATMLMRLNSLISK